MKRTFSLFAVFALGCGGAAETVAAYYPSDATAPDPVDGFVTVPIIPGPPVLPPLDASDDSEGDATVVSDAPDATLADASADSGSTDAVAVVDGTCHHPYFWH